MQDLKVLVTVLPSRGGAYIPLPWTWAGLQDWTLMNGMWQSNAAWLPKLGLKVIQQQPGVRRTLALGAQPPGEARHVCSGPQPYWGAGVSPSHHQRWREGGRLQRCPDCSHRRAPHARTTTWIPGIVRNGNLKKVGFLLMKFRLVCCIGVVTEILC